MQIFLDSIVSQFPKEIWTQKKNKPNIEKWPESLGIVLEFYYIKRRLLYWWSRVPYTLTMC